MEMELDLLVIVVLVVFLSGCLSRGRAFPTAMNLPFFRCCIFLRFMTKRMLSFDFIVIYNYAKYIASDGINFALSNNERKVKKNVEL